MEAGAVEGASVIQSFKPWNNWFTENQWSYERI